MINWQILLTELIICIKAQWNRVSSLATWISPAPGALLVHCYMDLTSYMLHGSYQPLVQKEKKKDLISPWTWFKTKRKKISSAPGGQRKEKKISPAPGADPPQDCAHQEGQPSALVNFCPGYVGWIHWRIITYCDGNMWIEIVSICWSKYALVDSCFNDNSSPTDNTCQGVAIPAMPAPSQQPAPRTGDAPPQNPRCALDTPPPQLHII